MSKFDCFHVDSERTLYRVHLDPVAVSGNLYAPANTLRAVVHKLTRPPVWSCSFKLKHYQC